MITKVKINNPDDVFAEDYIEMDVPRGVKILSNEPYVQELYDMYMDNGVECVQPESGGILDATVISIGAEMVELDIKSKQSAYVSIKKEDIRYIDNLKVNDPVKAKIKIDDIDGTVWASITKAKLVEKIGIIVESIGNPVAYRAIVKELIPGGYFLEIDNISVFMPGSLAGMNKLWDFESLLGKEITVMPINYSPEKQTVVVSRRAYLQTLLTDSVEEAKKDLSKEYEGFVTGTTKFGVFAEFEECMTGLISSSELDDASKKLFDEGNIKPGHKISFRIKDVISENKIMLSQVPDTSWDGLESKYPPSSKATGLIIRIRNYGAFIELEKGVVGMLHVSEYEKDSLKEGETVEIIINKIDIDNKRIVMKSAY